MLIAVIRFMSRLHGFMDLHLKTCSGCPLHGFMDLLHGLTDLFHGSASWIHGLGLWIHGLASWVGFMGHIMNL